MARAIDCAALVAAFTLATAGGVWADPDRFAETEQAGSPDADVVDAGSPDADDAQAGSPDADDANAGSPDADVVGSGNPDADMGGSGTPDADVVGSESPDGGLAGAGEAARSPAATPAQRALAAARTRAAQADAAYADMLRRGEPRGAARQAIIDERDDARRALQAAEQAAAAPPDSD
jgi:hypothetical protein